MRRTSRDRYMTTASPTVPRLEITYLKKPSSPEPHDQMHGPCWYDCSSVRAFSFSEKVRGFGSSFLVPSFDPLSACVFDGKTHDFRRAAQ